MNYAPHTADEHKAMLQTIGVKDFEALVADIPAEARLKKWNLPSGLSEMELQSLMVGLAVQNQSTQDLLCFRGAGVYDHFIPAAVADLVMRGEFSTAYTPYQPEVSQGTLQAIYEFQSFICALTGMEAANASMYDGATAVAEAALLALKVSDRSRILVADSVHPEYREVLETYLRYQEVQTQVLQGPAGVADLEALEKALDEQTAALVVQCPNFFGNVESLKELAEAAHAKGALLIVASNLLSLGVLEAPGVCGADIVAGEAQPFGNAMSYGGPHVGYFACGLKLARRMPGRVAGRAQDGQGHWGYVLTLQGREQHIRRQRATSNICTNQALCALAATVHLSLLGQEGLRQTALANLAGAHSAAGRISGIEGFELCFEAPYFNEFAVRCPGGARDLDRYLWEEGILGGVPLGAWYPQLENAMLFCVTEKRTEAEIERLLSALKRWKP
ncbi:MAG: aminomethyl-transferring glycine dehydrogenase subunit GcvPA [Candidatus Omnitrophica bacterium]|nr:aminomethyl-transferring glycine dehydrogenase subunit GcvPA [Candidatus Omnitrophota bacterium]